MSNKKWFVVALLYESVHNGEPKQVDENYDNSTETYEESHLLVKAESSEDATLLGKKLGQEAEHDYKNQYEETVCWKLVKVLDVFELMDEELKTGTEVYSRYILAPRESGTQDI
ncbi:DUF4288 domain-containing protein [Niallia taxi]|uniref:DUF4288 domain-containing protein n=1 Tax=Niallia taxi TaxID=2499688 RepID=A0A437KD18_9BACI|nr:DUF4288 domain-containing protein [Niallia taxi]MDK8639438.1 DUF4288 domain-containing protein [Niallia taxi]RVT65007.1 DUF4288 domain-containing protein [Niallia taxi]